MGARAGRVKTGRPTGMRIRRWWLGVVSRRLNPLTLRAARSGLGPFSVVRHVGRSSGKAYQTPVILARVTDGFIAFRLLRISDAPRFLDNA